MYSTIPTGPKAGTLSTWPVIGLIHSGTVTGFAHCGAVTIAKGGTLGGPITVKASKLPGAYVGMAVTAVWTGAGYIVTPS